jgi:tetratricopeptide (TPR) repeat protein
VLNAALSIQRKLLGEDHPDVLATLNGLAATLEQENNWAEAEIPRRELLAKWRKRAGDHDSQVLKEIEALHRNFIARKKFAEAEQLLDEALTPSFIQQRSSVKLLALRIDLRARRGQLQEAASDAALALQHEPNSNERYHVLAALSAKIGDFARYEALCREFFAAFHQTTNIYVADQLAKTCLLTPSAKIDLPALDRLADVALTGGTGDKFSMPFFQACKALSQYRQGKFSEAAAWARKPLTSSSRYSHGQACAVLAMACWRLGEKDEARAMFEKGNALSPPVIPEWDSEDPGKAWLAWIYARISLDEAAALLQPSSTGGTGGKQ